MPVNPRLLLWIIVGPIVVYIISLAWRS